MSTAIITPKMPAISRSATRRPWDELCEECYDPSVIPDPRSFAHIVIFMDNGRMIASPECGQHRFDITMAGHLALAGVQVLASEEGACELRDPEQLDKAVTALNAAGADVTVALV